MKQVWKLARRSLWRNKRWTIITLASVFLAVVLAIGLRSVQKGAYQNMINNAVRFSTGYMQVHAKGYWEDQSINNAFAPNENLQKIISGNANVSLAVPRLESFALASSGPHTKGVEVMGINPGLENKMNGLAGKITEGSYLTMQDSGILIGDGLAKYLKLNKGDTIVLLGQGYHGVTAAGQYRIREFSIILWSS